MEARMDGTLEQRLLWRINALREALSDIERMRDGVTHQVARNALHVDDGNAKLSTSGACTCHPDDNPPVPCPRKYALTECRAAAVASHDGGRPHGV